MKRFLVVVLCMVSIFTAMSAFGAGKAEDSIRFGVNYELTGDFPIIGTSAREGILLAVEQINAAGGVMVGGKAYQMVPVFLDNGFSEGEAAVVTQKFADDEGILAMIGPNDSAMCLASAQIVNAEGLPTITPWATNIDITKGGSYFFRACFTDDFQGAILAKYAFEKEGARTAAALYDKSNPYNVGIATIFSKTFEQMGGKVVEFQAYNAGDTDFNAQLTRIIAKKPDILILPNFYEEVVNQATQARRLGYAGKFLGSDTWGDSSILAADTEHLLNNAVWVGHYHVDIASDMALRFIEAYKKKFGTSKVPNDIVALNYDTVFLLKKAIEVAGVLERDAIQKGLASIKLFEGVTGNMQFGGPILGDPKKTAVMIQIRDGAFRFLSIEKP
jgi:branched-chain amino acid transport system substrate-binding protein